MARTAIAIRHVAFEHLGAFEPVLTRHGYDVEYFDVGVRDFARLQSDEADLLFVLGGPIGAYQEREYPFLKEEVAVIERRLAAGKPLVGICLGAQLMARSLGARVYPGPAKEIGFAPLKLTAEGENSCLRHFADTDVLHWHGDTFDLPRDAARLASTEICANQAFSYGAAAIAFQFHPEAGSGGFEQWLIGHTCELAGAGIDVVSLRAEAAERLPGLRKRAELCIGEWLRALG